MFFQISKTKWAVVFAFMSMFVLGISDNIRGPLYPELIHFFNLTNSQASFSFAFTSTAAVLGNTMAAFSLKKVYLDRLLALSVALMIAGPFLMGISSTYQLYLVGAIILGLSFGAMGVAQNLLIAENTHGRQQTQALAGLHCIYGFASLIAPLLASRAPSWFLNNGWFLNNFSELTVFAPAVFSPAFTAAFTGWRSAFFIIGCFAGLLLVLVVSTSPKPQFSDPVTHDESIHGKKSSIATMLWFAGFFASYVGAEILVSSRLALYMRTYFNMSLENSSNYVTCFFIFMFIGRLFFTFKTFKAPLKKQLNISLSLSLVSLLLGLWLHPFFLAVVGLAMAPFYPLAIVYISEITGVQKRRFLTFAMGVQGLMVIFMHVGVGYLSDAFGLFYAFGVGIVLLIGSILCLNLHPKLAV